jgi:hypothetical protein
MDEPGSTARRTVTLTQIIDVAREALESAPPPPEANTRTTDPFEWVEANLNVSREDIIAELCRWVVEACACPPPAGEDELARLRAAVRVCDTKAEQLCEDESDPERVTSYRLRCGPWHRVLALTGTGVHPDTEESLTERLTVRAEAAEARAAEYRKALERLAHLHGAPGSMDRNEIVAEGRKIAREALDHVARPASEGEEEKDDPRAVMAEVAGELRLASTNVWETDRRKDWFRALASRLEGEG